MNLNMIDMIKPVNLHLFDGAAAGTGDGAAAPAGTEPSGETQASAADTQPRKKGDLSNVKYGKQDAEPPAAGEQQAEAAETAQADTPEDRQKKFDDLIGGEYKDLYTARTQALVNRRFSQTKRLEDENAKLREIAGILGQKYGIEGDGDFSKLKAAIENDDDIWAQAAEEAGMSTEQYKEFAHLKRQNAALQAMRENDVAAQQRRQKAESWMQEAEQLREKFPQFDLQAELEDRNFVAAINAGVPMELVYKGKYYDQNLNEAAQTVSKQTEKKVVDNIRAKGSRPAENGTAAQSAAFTVRSDPSKLTLADFEEIARRAARGERITF